MKSNIWLIISIFVISFLFIYKLDYAYFFTDEILYAASGEDYVHGIYTRNLQHPLLGKYFVGFITLINPNNVFLLRLPYAFMGVISAFIVYLIIKKHFDTTWGIVGMFVYTLSPFIYETTRMVMFESPMHLFWLLFHLFFLEYIYKNNKKYQILSGIFLGLSIATKIPSILLYVFSFIIYFYYQLIEKKNKNIVKILKDLLSVYLLSCFVYGFTYIHLFIKNGFNGLIEVAKITHSILLGRNEEGKEHVVNGIIYNKSPWWFYLYYINSKYNVLHMLLIYLSPLVLFLKRNFFVIYWSIFLLLNVVFFQVIPLKNSRYIASIEISLIFLTVCLLHYLFTNINNKLLKILMDISISVILIYRLFVIIDQKPTEYNYLYQYFRQETNNFENTKRMYVFGSIRSSKWYARYIPEDALISRRDWEIMCRDFYTFDYIVFDKEELLKDPQNTLYEFVQQNLNSFEKINNPTFFIFKKLPNALVYFDCPLSIK